MKRFAYILAIAFLIFSFFFRIPAAQSAPTQPPDSTADVVYGQRGDFTTGEISAYGLYTPYKVVLDGSGGLYVTDWANSRVLYYPAGETTATRVYGQGGSFGSGDANQGDSAACFYRPTGLALDAGGGLYVADRMNNRVLYFPPGGSRATRVYGQGGSFDTGNANNGGVSANSLYYPYELALDAGGGLYVADAGNNRVLYYPAGQSTAIRVYGQAGSFATNAMNQGGLSASSLNYPTGLALDAGGGLYVADRANNRVLYYPAGQSTATRVYGQGGDFTYGLANKGGLSANSLYNPTGLALDASGSLYVADYANNRVLVYTAAGSTTASQVYGQGGSFSTNTANQGGLSADSLFYPTGLALDAGGSLYVADSNNNRVLVYPAGGASAARVYGQGGSFSTNTPNQGGISADNLSRPSGLVLDGSGGLYVTDMYHSRVLYYPAWSTTPTRVYGQAGSFATANANKGGLSADSLYSPWGVALDSSGGLYVVDRGNNRVLYYPAGETTATRVYGQGGSFTTGDANKGGVSANSLNFPTGVALDSSGGLYVADRDNNRVLYYPPGETTATRVYGQAGSFTTSTANLGGLSASSLESPNGAAVDSSGGLYIADRANSRVLYYPVGSTTATRVYGQAGSFTTSTSNKGGLSANSLYGPFGVAVDGSSSLYVMDFYNNRVLYYPAGSVTATQVYGQGGSFTTNTANLGGISAGSLNSPMAAAVDSRGSLYVADFDNNRVLEYFAPDPTPPLVSAFTAASPSASLTITITAFSATDDFRLSGYLITQSAAPPAPADPGWSAAAPTTYTVTGPGTVTLYPWAKDAAGNVSAVYAAPAVVIVQAPAMVSLGGLAATYDGAPKPVTATTTPPGLQVSITYAGLSTPPTEAGSYAVTATIQELTYLNASASGTLVIAPAATTARLQVPASRIKLGQPATLTVTVSPVGAAAGAIPGTVTFMDGATFLGTADLVDTGSGYSASLAFSSQVEGDHLLSASYSGSKNFAPCAADAVTLMVERYPLYLPAISR